MPSAHSQTLENPKMHLFTKSPQEISGAAHPNPDELMRRIDKAIAAAEYIRANRQLAALQGSSTATRTRTSGNKDPELQGVEDAFRAALAQHDPQKVIPLLQDAASKCASDKVSPMVKMQKLISLAMEKLNRKQSS